MNAQRSRITGRGQIQIPARIRKAIGADIGDEIEFVLNDSGEIRVRLIKRKKLSELAGALHKRREFPGLEKEEEATKKRVSEKVAKKHEQD